MPPGGRLTPDDLDRCREDYDLEAYDEAVCDMGVDVGKRLHVIIREHAAPHRLRSVGTVDGFEDLDLLMSTFNLRVVMVDARPDGHAASQFARRHAARAWLADYDRQPPGHQARRGEGGRPNRLHINRSEAFDELTAEFKAGRLALPPHARVLGGRKKAGMGEYYRQVLAHCGVSKLDPPNTRPRYAVSARGPPAGDGGRGSRGSGPAALGRTTAAAGASS